MTQPVIDTLRVSENLEESSMDRRQAESVARTLGEELGEHVAVQSDLDTGFQGVRSDMALTRSELEAKIGEVRSEMALMRSELEAKIGEVRSEMALMRSELEAKIGEVRSEVALMRSELEAKIGEVRSEVALMRSELEAKIGEMRSEVALMRSELEARIEGVRTEMKALNTRFNLGFGLMLAFLSVLVGIGLLNLDRTSAHLLGRHRRVAVCAGRRGRASTGAG